MGDLPLGRSPRKPKERSNMQTKNTVSVASGKSQNSQPVGKSEDARRSTLTENQKRGIYYTIAKRDRRPLSVAREAGVTIETVCSILVEFAKREDREERRRVECARGFGIVPLRRAA